MTRTEHLEFCKKCLNRKFDPKQGLICNLTEKIADFEETCSNFKLDETVLDKVIENNEISSEDIISGLDEKVKAKLKAHQDFYFAAVGGLVVTLASAVLWAVITVAIQYQVGFMAIGVGLLVGFSVQYFGAGVDKKFGYLGALLALLGCLFGNLFSQVGFTAQQNSLGYIETLTFLNFSSIIDILAETFAPIDLLFYGIAMYEGYRFAFRRVSAGELVKLQSDSYKGFPLNYKLRMPLFIGSIVILSFFFLKLSKGTNGFKTFHYESGKKMSEGEMKKSKEHGKWNYWYENGNLQLTAFYDNGLPDSTWQWYDETGKPVRTGNYKKGLEHGRWMNYDSSGALSDSGSYIEGRMNGLWKYWFANGSLSQTGYYKRNIPDSLWQSYFENGQLNSVGNMINAEQSGTWTTHYRDGSLCSQIKYGANNKEVIENVWNPDGKQTVTNGNGIFELLSDSGIVILTGKVENGLRIGKWITFYENGNKKEEGLYENTTYRLMNFWTLDGTQKITNGDGLYITYYPGEKESVFEAGEVVNGFREGVWKVFYESTSTVLQEQNYHGGKLNGPQKFYYENGQLSILGKMVDGLREGEWTWYFENGNVSSTVNFSADKKDGKQMMWSESGDKTKEELYKNGELAEEKVL